MLSTDKSSFRHVISYFNTQWEAGLLMTKRMIFSVLSSFILSRLLQATAECAAAMFYTADIQQSSSQQLQTKVLTVKAQHTGITLLLSPKDQIPVLKLDKPCVQNEPSVLSALHSNVDRDYKL